MWKIDQKMWKIDQICEKTSVFHEKIENRQIQSSKLESSFYYKNWKKQCN
jgi:hypothetical protein